MSEEDELRRLAVELRILQGTAEALQSRINFLNAAFAELDYARRTLEGLENEKVDAPIFVPIGGGSYIKAKLGEVDKIVYGVGAGIAIEKTLKEAKEKVESRVSRLEKTKQSLEQQLAQTLRRIQEDQDRLQELSAELRNRERREDVRATS
ncbi:prefoldin subunit alpha [Candidatus Bathyarchaeota archaeon]|nr:MAG: prefoldin subunit alpha [Candidatus Bathyarchaeota archaeon]